MGVVVGLCLRVDLCQGGVTFARGGVTIARGEGGDLCHRAHSGQGGLPRKWEGGGWI